MLKKFKFGKSDGVPLKILEETYQRQMIVRLKTGDEYAFNELYKAYSKPMYLRIMRLVRDGDVAKELLQELFLKLWVNRKTLDTDKSFQAYMYIVAQNLVYNYFRRIVGEQSLVTSLLLKGPDNFLNAEELFENRESVQLLQCAIDQLPPQRKQAFNLCKIEGKSYEEAGQILGISIATVNSHVSRSMRSIRDYLLKHQDVTLLLMSLYIAAQIKKP